MRFVLISLILMSALARLEAAPLRAADVLAVANSQGDRAALERYFECGPKGDVAYGKVASGAAEWIAVAVRLINESDACVSESLHDSIARALVHNPSEVLTLVNSSPRLGADQICLPFMSDEEDSKLHLSYLNLVEKVLRRINAAALTSAKNACLLEIRKMRRAIESRSNLSLQATPSARRR